MDYNSKLILNTCLVCDHAGQGLFCTKCQTIGIVKCQKKYCNKYHLVDNTDNCSNNRFLKMEKLLKTNKDHALQLYILMQQYWNHSEESSNKFRNQIETIKKSLDDKVSYESTIQDLYNDSMKKFFSVNIYDHESDKVYDVLVHHGMNIKIVLNILSILMKKIVNDRIIYFNNRVLTDIITDDINSTCMLSLQTSDFSLRSEKDKLYDLGMDLFYDE